MQPRVRLFVSIFVSVVSAGALYAYWATGGFCTNLISDRVARDQLLQAWKEGRVSILVRHTEKCLDEDPNDCPPGQALTESGKLDAKIIGQGIAELLKQPYQLYTSNVERTLATAKLAFPGKKPETVAWLREDCKQDLQTELNKPPSGNRIMITHSTCMNVLQDRQGERLIYFNAGGSEDYGLAVFLLHPVQGGVPKVLGCLWPDDWEALYNE